jgi:choline transport protein
MILRRFRGPLPPHRWSLGKYGLFINIGAVAFLLIVWVFVFFPLTPAVTPETMNWSILMFGSTMLFAVVYYLLVGKKTYKSPVDLIERGD